MISEEEDECLKIDKKRLHFGKIAIFYIIGYVLAGIEKS